MDRFLLDVRHSLRSLGRSKALLIGAALTLALGIGATTTLFSIVHGATRELPFDDAHELVVLNVADPQFAHGNLVRAFDFAAWSAEQTSFEQLAAFRTGAMNIADPGLRPERRNVAEITASAFVLIGVNAARGRVFHDGDMATSAPDVVIIADDLWRARYHAAEDIIGRVIRMNGRPHTVIGVMPPGFGFPVNEQLWIPLRLDEAAQPAAGSSFAVFGRLRDDVSVGQARTQMSAIALRLARAYPDSHRDRGINVIPFVDMEMDPEVVPILWLMLFAVSFVLVIACANVANLLLARAATRTRDVAIRTALGASRRRLIAQQLLEAVMLALIGGAGGVLIAHIGVGFFDRATAGIIEAFWVDFRVDRNVLLFATSLVALAGIGAGILPALRASAAAPAVLLKDAGAASGLRIGRLSRTLVVVELALVCGLLGVSGSFVKAALELRAVALPFNAHNILTAEIGFADGRSNTRERRDRVVRELTTRLQATAGIEGATMASSYPGRSAVNQPFLLDGTSDAARTAAIVAITPGYLATLGATVLQGRDLTWSDDRAAPRVALVNQSWVLRYSPDRSPLGRTITFPSAPAGANPPGTAQTTIIGVVPDLQIQEPGEGRGEGIYLPLLQDDTYGTRILMRGNVAPLGLVAALRDRVEQIDPDMPVFEIATLYDAIYADARVLDAFGILFAAFGAGALFLAVVGVYGVVAFSVTQRTREYGVRMALGARRQDILSLVLRQGGGSILVGTGIGLLLAIGLHRTIVSLIAAIEPADVAIIASVIAVLAITGVTALLVPARRAAAIEPLRALRPD